METFNVALIGNNNWKEMDKIKGVLYAFLATTKADHSDLELYVPWTPPFSGWVCSVALTLDIPFRIYLSGSLSGGLEKYRDNAIEVFERRSVQSMRDARWMAYEEMLSRVEMVAFLLDSSAEDESSDMVEYSKELGIYIYNVLEETGVVTRG